MTTPTTTITGRPDLRPGATVWDADGYCGSIERVLDADEGTVLVDWSESGGETESADACDLATAKRCRCGEAWQKGPIQTIQWRANTVECTCPSCGITITLRDKGGRWLP